jgi:hypothetical protein
VSSGGDVGVDDQEVAFCRYCTFIALGIQRWLVGTEASINLPIASSAALHDAMACTV